MGKKSRQKKGRRQWIGALPDEEVQFGPVRIARYGRYIRYSNTSTEQQHKELLKRTREEHEKIKVQLEKEVLSLQQLVSRYSPVEIMHRAAYELLPLFLKYKSESEFSPEEGYFLPATEYLQYLIARSKPNEDGAKFSEDEWKALWGQAVKVLRLTQQYLFTRKVNDPPTEMDSLRFQLDSRRLMIRGRTYQFFLREYHQTSLEPYQAWLQENYGIGIAELLDGLNKIAEYQKSGVLDRYRDVSACDDILAGKLHEKGYAIGPDSTPEDVEKTRQALESPEFRSLYEDMQEKMRLTFTPAIFDITDLTDLPKPVLSMLSVRPGEAVLTSLTGPDYDDLSPLSPSILRGKPFLEVNGRFYTFYHSGFEDRLAEIIETDLLSKSPQLEPKFASRRHESVQSATAKFLTSIITPDFLHQNIYYPNPDKEGLTELDLLVSVDDVLLIVEVKAGGATDSASRGSPKGLERLLTDRIIEGQRQSERAEKYIKGQAEAPFFDETGKKIVCSIKREDYRLIFRVVVTREDLGWVGARIAVVSILDPNLSRSFPWHISIDDFRVVAELFKGEELQFIHYLEQRLRASAAEKLAQSDELEHIALYNKLNQYHEPEVRDMDRYSFAPAYMRDIDEFFADKAAGGAPSIPSQAMPPKMREFMNVLKDSRLHHRFEVASFLLSMGNGGRTDFAQALSTLQAARKEGRHKTIRFPLNELSFGISVTFVTDKYWREEQIRSVAHKVQSGCKKWLIVRLEDLDEIKVMYIESVVEKSFTDSEINSGKATLEKFVAIDVAENGTGRNDRCPCGSGKKYKKCHGL